MAPITWFLDTETKSFTLTGLPEALELFVVRRKDRYFAYVNRCPHTGITLNWLPDRFLDVSEQLIQCSTHGALFRIEDGLCLRGPCVGASLNSLDLSVSGPHLYLQPPLFDNDA